MMMMKRDSARSNKKGGSSSSRSLGCRAGLRCLSRSTSTARAVPRLLRSFLRVPLVSGPRQGTGTGREKAIERWCKKCKKRRRTRALGKTVQQFYIRAICVLLLHRCYQWQYRYAPSTKFFINSTSSPTPISSSNFLFEK